MATGIGVRTAVIEFEDSRWRGERAKNREADTRAFTGKKRAPRTCRRGTRADSPTALLTWRHRRAGAAPWKAVLRARHTNARSSGRFRGQFRATSATAHGASLAFPPPSHTASSHADVLHEPPPWHLATRDRSAARRSSPTSDRHRWSG